MTILADGVGGMASLSMDDARQRVDRGILEARELGVAANIAVCDAGAYLLCFVRMDQALLGSIDLAVQKARTAALFRKESGALGSRSQPGGQLWSIEHSNGGLVVFGGGVPIFDGQRQCIGAVGVSGGSVEQDEQIARAASEGRRRDT